MLTTSTIRKISSDLGLELVAVIDAGGAEARLSHEESYLKRWQDAGFAGELGYMLRSASLFTRLESFFEAPATVLIFAVPYRHPGDRGHEPLLPGFGRVARYAWGVDYHGVLKERLSEFANRLQHAVFGQLRYRAFSDSVPLLERSLACAAGLGFIGNNSLLIARDVGSYLFLAELIIDQPVVVDAEIPHRRPRSRILSILPARDQARPGAGCGKCRRCLDLCPTAAFSAPGVLDARRCISYLTIEKRGAFNHWEEEAIGEWLFGCDCCQDACPFNKRPPLIAGPPEFSESGAAGPVVGRAIDLPALLDLRSEEEFKKRFSGTAVLRLGREGLLRNACAIIANTSFIDGVPALLRAAREDPSAVVRDQSLRSLRRLRH